MVCEIKSDIIQASGYLLDKQKWWRSFKPYYAIMVIHLLDYNSWITALLWCFNVVYSIRMSLELLSS